MAELARQQAAVAKSPAAKAKVQGPSMGERFSGVGEKFKDNPRVLGVFAVLVLVVMIKYVSWPFGKGDQEFLRSDHKDRQHLQGTANPKGFARRDSRLQ